MHFVTTAIAQNQAIASETTQNDSFVGLIIIAASFFLFGLTDKSKQAMKQTVKKETVQRFRKEGTE